jgi:hyperosmotically inducible protein
MTSLRPTFLSAMVLIVIVAAGAVVTSAQSRSVGQVIDDATISTEVKAKLVADKLSNLTQIGVGTRNGVVTLTGTVDSLERQSRAVQIAGSVKGVRTVVSNIQVTGAPVTPAPPPTASVPDPSTVDVTGVVSQVDPSTGTVILQDGRVLRITGQTLVWQPSTIEALRPGSQVLVRGAAPVRVQPSTTGEWRMGTVRAVDRAASQIVLTDGTVVRLSPSVNIRRGSERLTLEQIAPGSEVVIRPMASSPTGAAEGSALPGRMGTAAAVIDAAEINVVWMPSGGLR